jgi:acylphosphatase
MSIRGYVQNKKDGSVEVLAEGERDSLLKFVEELRIGPSGSSVEDFQLKWEDPKNDLNEFKILR